MCAALYDDCVRSICDQSIPSIMRVVCTHVRVYIQVQTGKNTDLELLYRKFLSGATNLLRPGGKMVVLVLKALQFLEITRTYGQFKLLHTYVVKTRNNLPTIFVFERREADQERESLRRQLHDLGQYVDISGDIFEAIHSSDGGSGGGGSSGVHGGGGGGNRKNPKKSG